jgi:hypothetical protein
MLTFGNQTLHNRSDGALPKGTLQKTRGDGPAVVTYHISLDKSRGWDTLMDLKHPKYYNFIFSTGTLREHPLIAVENDQYYINGKSVAEKDIEPYHKASGVLSDAMHRKYWGPGGIVYNRKLKELRDEPQLIKSKC